MAIGLRARSALGASVVIACSGLASGSVRGVDVAIGSGAAIGSPHVVDHAGGRIHSLSARFDAAQRRLDWTVNFSDRVTKGFWLVLTNGPAAASAPGRQAIFYFDATAALDPFPGSQIFLTAYGFNGLMTATSWRDGDGNPSNDVPRGSSVGDQGDLIKGAFDTGWIRSLVAADTVLEGGISGRTLGFSVDVTDILAHVPRFNAADGAWTGSAFHERIGIALHPVRSFNATYDTVDNPADPTDYGRLRSLSLGMPGSFQGMNLLTYDVPAPGAGSLLVAAGLAGLRRRRR